MSVKLSSILSIYHCILILFLFLCVEILFSNSLFSFHIWGSYFLTLNQLICMCGMRQKQILVDFAQKIKIHPLIHIYMLRESNLYTRLGEKKKNTIWVLLLNTTPSSWNWKKSCICYDKWKYWQLCSQQGKLYSSWHALYLKSLKDTRENKIMFYSFCRYRQI